MTDQWGRRPADDGYGDQPPYPGGPPQLGPPQYGAPQYGPPQYGPPQYGPPPGYGQPPYPYPPAGYPYGPPAVIRPSAVTGAAVLAHIEAGFVLIGSLITLILGATTADLGLMGVRGARGVVLALIVLGVAGLVAGGLLIGGAVKFTGGGGSSLLLAGLGLTLAVCVGWAVLSATNDGGSGSLVIPLTYAVLPVISLSLASGAAARGWRRPQAQTQQFG